MINSKVDKKAKLLTDTLCMEMCQTSWGVRVRACVYIRVLGCLEMYSPFGQTLHISTLISECLVPPKKLMGAKGGKFEG